MACKERRQLFFLLVLAEYNAITRRMGLQQWCYYMQSYIYGISRNTDNYWSIIISGSLRIQRGFKVFTETPFWNWFPSWLLEYSNWAVRSRLSTRAVGLRCFNHSSFIKRNAVISNDNALCEKKDCWERSMTLVFNSNWELKPPSK